MPRCTTSVCPHVYAHVYDTADRCNAAVADEADECTARVDGELEALLDVARVVAEQQTWAQTCAHKYVETYARTCVQRYARTYV